MRANLFAVFLALALPVALLASDVALSAAYNPLRRIDESKPDRPIIDVTYEVFAFIQNTSTATLRIPTSGLTVRESADGDILRLRLFLEDRTSTFNEVLKIPDSVLGVVELEPGERALVFRDYTRAHTQLYQRILVTFEIPSDMGTRQHLWIGSAHKEAVNGTEFYMPKNEAEPLQTTPMTRSESEKTIAFGHPQRGV